MCASRLHLQTYKQRWGEVDKFSEVTWDRLMASKLKSVRCHSSKEEPGFRKRTRAMRPRRGVRLDHLPFFSNIYSTVLHTSTDGSVQNLDSLLQPENTTNDLSMTAYIFMN
ncbi:hypothetical protein Y032_0125g1263 [Ancylostoma ceylanicum]|uniref:Uncharacterized protein n=1 Tax=Ancylostoma ceylanicum TaxID=53326 RepID=A0A016T8Y7_9BILA|nr:hypothetical protein Y032_0125g1263 [Ancylostoma ceylanicum]